MIGSKLLCFLLRDNSRKENDDDLRSITNCWSANKLNTRRFFSSLSLFSPLPVELVSELDQVEAIIQRLDNSILTEVRLRPSYFEYEGYGSSKVLHASSLLYSLFIFF